MRAPSTIDRNAVMALANFNNWVRSGGEYRAGLPARSMQGLNNSVLNIRSISKQLAYNLTKLRSHWIQLGRVQEIDFDLARTILNTITVELHVLKGQSTQLIRLSNGSRAILQGTRELVKKHENEDHIIINEANKKLVQAKRSQSQARIDLKNAKAELSGSKGFLNGFLTGVTLTAHNPVKKNMDKANNAINSYNHQIIVINQQMNLANQSSRELRESSVILYFLNNLNRAFNSYLNFLTIAKSRFDEAHQDGVKSGEKSSARLAAYYMKKSGKEMSELFSWIDTLNYAR